MAITFDCEISEPERAEVEAWAEEQDRQDIEVLVAEKSLEVAVMRDGTRHAYVVFRQLHRSLPDQLGTLLARLCSVGW